MTSYAAGTALERLQAIYEAIDRALRAQSYGVRGERVERPKIEKLFEQAEKLEKEANVAPGACRVFCVNQATSAANDC